MSANEIATRRSAAPTRPLSSLLRKGVKFEFTPHHEGIVREMLDELFSPNNLAFPDLEAAISGSRNVRLVTDASARRTRCGDRTANRPLRYFRRTTLDIKRKWSISELGCAAIVQAIRRNKKMFYVIPCKVEIDYQLRQNLSNLSNKSNRV